MFGHCKCFSVHFVTNLTHIHRHSSRKSRIQGWLFLFFCGWLFQNTPRNFHQRKNRVEKKSSLNFNTSRKILQRLYFVRIYRWDAHTTPLLVDTYSTPAPAFSTHAVKYRTLTYSIHGNSPYHPLWMPQNTKTAVVLCAFFDMMKSWSC